MFKKFLLTFVLCMGIFGVTAFASVQTPGGESYDYYLYLTSVSGNDDIKVYSNSPFVIKNGYYYSTNSTGVYYVNGVYNGEVPSNYSLYIVSNWELVGTNSPDISNDGDVIPPEIAPTVEKAIAKIVPDLSAQLQNLLPVGVILLSAMLVVSLVRRLVPLFL